MAAAGAIVEEVALNLEEAAQITRKFNPSGVGFFTGGLLVGVAVGFYFGYRWNKEQIKAEIYREAEEDIGKIRDYYEAKVVAATPKPQLVEIIEEQGYRTDEVEEEVIRERPLPAPVPIIEEPVEEPVVISDSGEARDTSWDYPRELAVRTPDAPYVIHQSELGETGYDHVSYTYYAEDDVLCDEDDTPLTHADIVVGQDNLKWGHGSGDPEIVFVRNDKLELDMEINRSPKSYEVEVLGHTDDQPN